MRRHHFVGAGFLASALGMYSFAARLGIVPGDFTSAVRWVTGANLPPLPGTPFGANGPEAFPPPAAAPYSYSPEVGITAGPANVAYQPPGYGAPAYGAGNYAAGDIACYFSPSGGCTDAVVAAIGQARQQILVQAYSFTSVPIANALVAAHQRGVAVYIVLDKSQRTEQYSGADYVANSGIPTLIDAAHAIAHNKIMLIDGQTIITGSFNFTTNAEQHNAENLLVIRNRPDLYQAYETNFRNHYQHSQPYQPRAVGSRPPTQTYLPTADGRLLPSPQPGFSSDDWGGQVPQSAQNRGAAGNPFGVMPR